MKALISGGAGFIGSHLAEYLLECGYEVVILDNFSTGRRENIDALPKEKLKILEVDITSFDNIVSSFEGVDYVFHLAALADVVPSIEKPLNYHKANVDGTVCMLEASRKHGVKKFVYTGSSSCYGVQKTFPTDENASVSPEYPYALTKCVGEVYVFHWAKIYKLPIVSLRLFNVYGPRSRTSGTYGAVFGVFLAQKLAGKQFTVVGDGQQTRDFVFVKDVAKAFKMAAESNIVCEIFNVGSGNPNSVNKLVELLGGEKVFIPKRPGEPDSTHANIEKIKRVLSWNPEVSFEDGVKIMLENIEYWRNAPVWTPETIEESTKEWFKHLSK